MASKTLGACCATGFKHEGTPDGEVKSIGDVPTYVVFPKDNKTPDTAVLFITDVFGIVTHNQLVADDFANNGYVTVLPDLFAGDALQFGDFNAGKVDFPAWLAKHPSEAIDAVVEGAIKYIREDLGIKKVVAVGYCLGAKYVIRHLKNGVLDAGFAAHPSLVTKEELAAIEKPLSIAAAEVDQVFTTELRHASEEILIKTGQPYQLNLFGGVSHGFGVRGDVTKKEGKYAKEQAFLQAVAWFKYFL